MKKMYLYLLLPTISVSLVLGACSGSNSAANSAEIQESSLEVTSAEKGNEETTSEQAEEAGAHADGIVHWGYSGDIGPDYWYSLAPEYAVAKDGKAQSPINIAAKECVSEGAPEAPVFFYNNAFYEVENNGHTIQMNPLSSDNKMELDGVVYTLMQAHFHAPSEHQLEGENLEMELHMVHQDDSGNNAVFGLLITEGAENKILKEVFEKLPVESTPEGEFVALNQPVNLGSLIADGTALFRYEGSLTTPPCTEGVSWVICESVVELSMEQINAFKAIYDGNNRPVQEINERNIYNCVGE